MQDASQPAINTEKLANNVNNPNLQIYLALKSTLDYFVYISQDNNAIFWHINYILSVLLIQ